MADNLTVQVSGGTAVLRTKDNAGVHTQAVVLMDGSGSVLTAVPVDVLSGSVSVVTHTTGQGQILSSAPRTATPTLPDFTNEYGSALVVVVNVTAGSGFSVTPVVKMKANQVSSAYVTVLTGSPITTPGTYTFYVGPEAVTVYTGSVVTRLWRSWTVSLTHADATSVTYSAEYVYLL